MGTNNLLLWFAQCTHYTILVTDWEAVLVAIFPMMKIAILIILVTLIVTGLLVVAFKKKKVRKPVQAQDENGGTQMV